MHKDHSTLKEFFFIEYWTIINTNVCVIPYYINPIFC